MDLPNLRVVHAHTDHWSDHTRFDLLTFKAVGSLETCLACAAKRIAPGGHVAIHKTANLTPQEVKQGTRAAKRHNFEHVEELTHTLPLPKASGHFVLHVFRKSQETGRVTP